MIKIEKHKFLLVNILKDIYSDTLYGPILGLKGGTAAYLFYGLPRFSVDLDFDLLDVKKEKFVLDKIKEILEGYGEIKDIRKKRFTLFFLLSYDETSQNIKVEISKRKFPNHYQIKNYLGIPMLIMQKDDMFSHKLVALLERKNIASRDLFDLYYFMKNNWQVNKKLVELRTGIKFKEYLKQTIRAMEKFDETYILQGMGELLDSKQEFWVKDNLKKELLFLLKFYSENN